MLKIRTFLGYVSTFALFALLNGLIVVFKAITANNWTLKDEGQCFYTVISRNRSVILTDRISTCDYVEPYIIFIGTNFTNVNVTSNFFNTTFDSWIRHLIAVNNNWHTVFPIAFSNLKNVLYMDLSENHIKNIDGAFKDLKVMDFLNLSRNHIENVNSNTFMISENETSLHLLDLSYNLLSHLPENVFVNIENLRMLYLQGNKISILGDEIFRSLKKLVYLNLSYNKLAVLEPTKYLSYLTDLDVSYNNIAVLDKNTFAGFTSLQSADLSHNKIKDLDVLENLASSLNIHLENNNMDGSIEFVSNNDIEEYADIL